MKFYNHKHILYSVGLIMLIAGFAACNSTMHDPYEEFIEDGEIIYPGTADSVQVYPGMNRIRLSWPAPSDPTVSKARIYWHNGQDSVEVSLDSVLTDNTVNVILKNLEEGSYTFNIYNYDNEGNSSIAKTAIGRVYGDSYASSLLSRLINEAVFADDTLKIQWGSADETVLATEISYTNVSGGSSRMSASGESDSTIILNYDFDADNTFRYRTMYKPDSLAIDTFYTDYETVRVFGPRVEFDRTGWTATASSYDTRHGTGRAPDKVLDGDRSTIWVNSIDPPTNYPHSIKIDMASVKEDVFGLWFWVRDRAETPKTIEILVSEDDVSWRSLGRFSLERITTKQYIDFSEGHNIRYFEVIAIEPSGNNNNIVIEEIGAYER